LALQVNQTLLSHLTQTKVWPRPQDTGRSNTRWSTVNEVQKHILCLSEAKEEIEIQSVGKYRPGKFYHTVIVPGLKPIAAVKGRNSISQ